MKGRYWSQGIAFLVLVSCNTTPNLPRGEVELTFNSSKPELTQAFEWAKTKALFYAHDNSDPVGYWYEAALPNREAFCMRDVSHQAIGAEILGLGKHNYNMLLKFAQNISAEKDYCSYWEINRYDLPAPVDYENDQDFWYNLPANFDVTYAASRLYKWTGNRDYLENEDFINFYEMSLNQYVEHWDLSADKILNRDRAIHRKDSSRFGKNRGIPTYNEGGRGATNLGIDMTASIIAAYQAYAEMLKSLENKELSDKYLRRAQNEIALLNEFWWDSTRQSFRSIQYEDQSFDYLMVGENQAFLHYLLYFNALPDLQKSQWIVDQYADTYGKLIVELKSYLPIIFYEYGYADLATQMIIELCDESNLRRDYPENSFTVIEHISRGLMGLNVNADENTFSTLPHLGDSLEWAEISGVPLLANKVHIKHMGSSKTTAINQKGESLSWKAQLSGIHEFLLVNGEKMAAKKESTNGQVYSYVILDLGSREETTVSIAR